MNIIQALDDKGLLRPALGKQVESWRAWRAFHKAVHALPLDEAGELELFTKCTKRNAPPAAKPDEVFAICGRRSGKSFCIALEAVFTCLIADFWKPFLSTGERGYFLVVATDKLQCRVVMSYIKGFVLSNRLFRSQVQRETEEELFLRNGAVISISAANFRSIRGMAVIGCALDELAFWRDENAANPASEIIDAIRPAVVPGGVIFGISSAYAKQGLLYEQWAEHFGKDNSETLVWVADTRTMNPLFAQKKIDKALDRDMAVARAEYYSIFREDLEGLFTRAAIENAIVPGRQELPPSSGIQYRAFCDPSGGRHDSFALAIAHAEGRKVVIDLADEVKAPFQPGEVVKKFSATLKRYGIRKVQGDKYAGAWPAEAFQKHDIKYEPAERTASEYFLEMVPLLSDGRIELPDNERMQTQFLSLLRRTGPSGRDSVITPKGADAHGDLANAIAGVVLSASSRKRLSFCAFSEHDFYGSGADGGDGNWDSNYSRFLGELKR